MKEVPAFQQAVGLAILALAILHAVALAIDSVIVTDLEKLVVDGLDDEGGVGDGQEHGGSTIQIRGILGTVVETCTSKNSENSRGKLTS